MNSVLTVLGICLTLIIEKSNIVPLNTKDPYKHIYCSNFLLQSTSQSRKEVS